MNEYIAAYAHVEPLLKDYDQKLQRYSELCNTAQQRDEKRGPINIKRLHSRYKRKGVAEQFGTHRARAPGE
jgi:hypothetical protein